MTGKKIILLSLLFFVFQSSFGQSKVTLSGYVKDTSNGEALIGATIYAKEISAGASTNVYGFYSLTLPPGNYTVDISYVGYKSSRQQLALMKNTRLDIDLDTEASRLQEIVVIAKEEDQNKVQSIEMSTVKLDMKTIAKMPALLGEADVIKSLQMMPGVSTVGEGASGFNVRGGSVGQNLLLLDEAPVFNSSHMLGFFSAFNPDAVKDVKLYKGGIPARYGGRLSSLLDIRMKEGNNKETVVQGGVGTVFSRIAVESPIVKDKGSFIVAGRRSYIDILAAPLLNDFSLNFYDLTAKANYKINDNNRVYLSGYFGRDNFGFAQDQGLSWGSQTGTFRWNHLFNQKLFSNLSVIYSDYDYELKFGEDDDRLNWNSKITNFIIKPEFSYFMGSNNELNFGGEFIDYTFAPANTSGKSGGQDFNNTIDNKYADEIAAFISNTTHINKSLSVEYGIRLSNFRYMGPGPAYTFNDTIPGKRRTVIGEKEYGRGETIASYTNWEPRLSANFKIDDDNALKFSYNRTVQYVHLISNTVSSNPLDIWTPSSNNIKPQIGDQFAIGYFKNLPQDTWEVTVEAYYRSLDNQVDYINGAELLQNKYLEGDLLSGNGRAYGLEFYLQRKVGRLTGWASYTISRTELKIDGINKGDWYPTTYDHTHNLKLVGFYEINERWSVSSNFIFTTGTPTTSPTSKYYVQGIAVPHNANDSKNNYRLTNYHRLDLAFRLEGKTVKPDGTPRKNKSYWVFSVYNVYARRNAFMVDFRQTDQRFGAGSVIETEAIRTSILGTMVPAVSYNFKF